MGQGHYLKVIYGVVLDKAASKKLYKDDEAFEDAFDASMDAAGLDDVDRSYECKQEYIGIPLAANDGMDGHGMKELDELVGAVKLNEIDQKLRKGIGQKAIDKATKKWLAFSRAMGEKGFTLPEDSGLYLVADYD